MNNFKELTLFLDKYSVKYTIQSDCVEVNGPALVLDSKNLKSLPDSFGNLKINGAGLWLRDNNLTSLPESFGNLKIRGSLWLGENNLTSLPESFGNLKIGGGLYLNHNELTSLQESFGNLMINGTLSLGYNKLASLPESFGNLKIGGDLVLFCNNLTSLPESFGNLKIGRDLYLKDNNLTSEPIISSMKQTIEKDWCYIDRIVREIVSRKEVGDLSVIKTPFDFIVGKGNTWAHGRTIEEAIQDYNFKLRQGNPEDFKDLDIDKPMSHEEAINVYRTITRACTEGIRQWMSGKTFPEQITIREIINLTQSAHGGNKFKQFFNQ